MTVLSIEPGHAIVPSDGTAPRRLVRTGWLSIGFGAVPGSAARATPDQAALALRAAADAGVGFGDNGTFVLVDAAPVTAALPVPPVGSYTGFVGDAK